MTAASLGADYIASNLDQVTDVFTVCLMAYSLVVANHKTKSYAVDRMNKLRTEGTNHKLDSFNFSYSDSYSVYSQQFLSANKFLKAPVTLSVI